MAVPSLHSIWKCYCELRAKISGLVDSDNQTLSLTGDVLEISGGNSVTLTHPAQLIATGPFTGATTPSGWWAGWSPIRTANQVTEARIPWALEHAAITSPDVDCDFSFTYDLGGWYNRVRRARRYLWVDYRIKIDGVVVLTRLNNVYYYKDELNDTNPDVVTPIPVDLHSIGSIQASRLLVPANSTIEIETEVRDNINGVQTDGWARLIGGLRSTLKWDFTPRQIVIGRV